MFQTLVNNDVPSTNIMQLSGQKNVKSITTYSTVSQKQQLNMSHTLNGMSSGEIVPQSGSSIPEKRKHEFDELTYPTFRPTLSQQSKQVAQQPLSLFSGAVISEGHINTLNQSPILSVREEYPNKTYIKESNLLIRILTSVCQFKHAGSDKQQNMKARVSTSVFQILNLRRTISTYFQDVLFYSNYFCFLTEFLLDNLDVKYTVFFFFIFIIIIFFIKTSFYKNVEAEINRNFKNVLRTFIRLKAGYHMIADRRSQ